ncbi:BlaI/MecI/CopY family transcriptional regulator [Bizionia sediminis]|uniref:BlaI/MecI/CopY family transcriptional regulator n=1 Tax=Bizionia sediminis TaxID=1737064 RepID=A0ABW5KQ58_9FLAO
MSQKKQLTRAEEEIMQVLWQLEKAPVKNIIKQLPDPKPAYNTVSTIVRILETKGFVDYEKKGKGHVYFPVIKKQDYSNDSINSLVNNYFQGSFKSMVSFFVKQNDISLTELESLVNEIHKDEKS